MRHSLKVDSHGRAVAGALFYRRVLRKRLRAEHPKISRKAIGQILDAYHDLMWEVLLSGGEARLGSVGRIKLTIRDPYIMSHPVHGELNVPQQPLLTGKLSPSFKGAVYDLEGVRYADPDDDQAEP